MAKDRQMVKSHLSTVYDKGGHFYGWTKFKGEPSGRIRYSTKPSLATPYKKGPKDEPGMIKNLVGNLLAGSSEEGTG